MLSQPGRKAEKRAVSGVNSITARHIGTKQKSAPYGALFCSVRAVWNCGGRSPERPAGRGAPGPARRGSHAGPGGHYAAAPVCIGWGRRTPGPKHGHHSTGPLFGPGYLGREDRAADAPEKKARPQRACRAWPCLFFWAAQAAQTFAPQGLAGASARPRRPGGQTAARAGAGGRRRTRHRPCAAGLPGVWMAARHRCRARHRIVTGGCLARYLRPLGPHRAGWGLGPGAEGWGPQIGHASGFRVNKKSGTPRGSALFQKGGRFRAVLRRVFTLPRFSRPVKHQLLPSCALPR